MNLKRPVSGMKFSNVRVRFMKALSFKEVIFHNEVTAFGDEVVRSPGGMQEKLRSK